MSEEIKGTVYFKLQMARCLLQEREVKKTGKNQHFNYYQLDDILPPINEICKEVGICPIVSFNREVASLTIHCNDGGGSVEFTAPMAAAKLPNGQEIQNLGASITYERRYLYMNAFEITEHDAIDQMSKEDHKKATKKKVINSSRFDMICNDVEDCDTVKDLTELYNKLETEYVMTLKIKEIFGGRRTAIEEFNSFCDLMDDCTTIEEVGNMVATGTDWSDNQNKICKQRIDQIENGER
jgi:hypothetical protein